MHHLRDAVREVHIWDEAVVVQRKEDAARHTHTEIPTPTPQIPATTAYLETQAMRVACLSNRHLTLLASLGLPLSLPFVAHPPLDPIRNSFFLMRV